MQTLYPLHPSPDTLFMTLCSSLPLIPALNCSTIIFYLVPFLSFSLPGTLVAMGTMMLLLRVEFREAHKHRGKEIKSPGLKYRPQVGKLQKNAWALPLKNILCWTSSPPQTISNKILTVKSPYKGRSFYAAFHRRFLHEQSIKESASHENLRLKDLCFLIFWMGDTVKLLQTIDLL